MGLSHQFCVINEYRDAQKFLIGIFSLRKMTPDMINERIISVIRTRVNSFAKT